MWVCAVTQACDHKADDLDRVQDNERKRVDPCLGRLREEKEGGSLFREIEGRERGWTLIREIEGSSISSARTLHELSHYRSSADSWSIMMCSNDVQYPRNGL